MKNANKTPKAPKSKKPVSTPAPEVREEEYTDEECDQLDEMFANLERFGYGHDEE